ncbi:MAG TPA: secondary thiamine-phosphate synthase enzyme YjbQ [Alphaproteobacteria bacterium]|jgi:secondary thiamine-phosphate synthase enzyme|nr:secondary thiamine-phosphate synthase enzyme YjbQ [Alphaproteobacteria bacterium]
MQQATRTIAFTTGGRGFTDITTHAVGFVREQGIETGLLTVFCRHTSASLLIQENADPDVLRDLETFFRKLAPEGDHYRHADEGPDDMPGHIRSALTQPSLSIPVVNGRPALGTWQAIYLYEHRARPHRREIVLHVIGQGPT